MSERTSTEGTRSHGPLAAGGVALLAVAVGGGVALAGAQGGSVLFGLPAMVLAVALAFAIQWVAFVPAIALKTEHFYDLTGSLTYLSVISLALVSVPSPNPRAMLVAAIVTVWTIRLGTFLFRRVRNAGKDARFDDIKWSAPRFFIAWTLQGLWVSLTLAAALAAITTPEQPPLGITDAIGLLVFACGFGVEVVADRQKSAFKADKEQRNGFITTGLWSRSRHPNYFGEIVLWAGVALVASSALSGWQWVTLVSPVFVALLLTRVSGVNLLEERADARWGGQPDYEAYKERTPVLVPRLGR